MEYRKFGNTDKKVSALGFGCMRLPIKGQNPSEINEELAIKMIRDAINGGINYFDTAYPYHGTDFSKGGKSEPLLAKALRNGYREKVHIATKLPSWLITSREDFDLYLNDQLSRLETESIDFYLLHALNKGYWDNLVKNDVFDFIEKALASGKIKHIGFSFHDKPDTFKEIVDAYNWDFCQIQLNYFDTEFQAGLSGLKHAADKGMGVVIMEPLRGGALVNKLPQESLQLLNDRAPERSNVSWALNWLWNQPGVSIVLSGMSTPEQLEENMQLAINIPNVSWSDTDNNTITKAARIIKDKQKVNCTTCGYCTPCPVGVSIPACFGLMNDYYVFDDPAAQMRYNAFIGEAGKASNCVKCGKCEEKCPQQISIMEKLEEVAELFEK